ncbi:MAG: LLM class flavin-dependent oxidoreductase [Actinomycetota bacterium]
MKLGILLPLFRDHIDAALEAAVAAETAGLDGIFAYDHLWPIGHRERPAFAPFPVLARALTLTSRVMVGPLVARVGLVENSVLDAQFRSLEAIASGRVIAPLGVGDGLSAKENEAYGLVQLPADVRRARLKELAKDLQARGISTWVGGSGPKSIAVARETGSAVNLWSQPASVVAEHAKTGEVTWAGDLPAAGEGLEEHLAALHQAGASWAIATYARSAEELVEAAKSGGWFTPR